MEMQVFLLKDNVYSFHVYIILSFMNSGKMIWSHLSRHNHWFDKHFTKKVIVLARLRRLN